MQAYSDPSRASDPHALPDVEVFYVTAADVVASGWVAPEDASPEDDEGWYWWPCFPGCLSDGDPVGPFATEADALADAQEGRED